MSEHSVNIAWQRKGIDFGYKSYSRAHLWKFQNGLEVEASAAPPYYGDAERIDPEEAFVAALSSCHMLTFLAVCAVRGLTVDDYQDRAVGYLEKNAEGKMVVNRVDLHPKVRFGENISVSDEELAELHERSHRDCFIANSVKTVVKTMIE